MNPKLLLTRICYLLLAAACSNVSALLKEFDDSVLFKLTWPSRTDDIDAVLTRQDDRLVLPDNMLLISTAEDERYICSLPQLTEESESEISDYTGPTPAELLQPLTTQRSCTYRIEMYWTYELCHGRFLLQYHEEKDNNRRTTRQEYYLGQYVSELAEKDDNDFDIMHPPNRKFEDQSLPYYPVRYVQGTICDISGRPRTATIKYVCVPNAKNQIHSLSEVSSCDYEVVVLTARLCTHPAYRGPQLPEHSLQCVPVNGAPERPNALTVWEKEQQWQTDQQYRKATFKEPSETPSKTAQKPEKPAMPQLPAQAPPVDGALARSFLAGEYCLYGGSGWWKHEYCHGKQVIQFHEDPKTGRVEILLGTWNKEAHLAWMAEHTHKQPIKVDGQIRQATHFYVDGDTCELTGKRRTVEVRLRCRPTQGNANAVTLYLLEPKSCEYILGVESQMFCDILQTADNNGLLR